jgi:ADP-ribose pyrophosphatase
MIKTVEIWKRKSSKEIADCRVFRVREDFCERDDGRKSSFFVIENPDWVNVIALNKNGEVVLIEQFRHGSEEIILELPGGIIDDGEEPLEAARRELLEETGFSSDNFVLLGKTHPNPAIQNNVIYHFLATNCEETAETDFDEHESVITKLASISETEKLIAAGEITHSLVVAAFYYYSIYETDKIRMAV